MKLLHLLSAIFLLSNLAFSQTNIDSLMIEKAPNCEDIAYNCTRLIETYYNESKIDSAIIILNYWEDKCGMNEPIFRTKILFSILQNKFNENLYDSTILNYLFQYENRVEKKQYPYYYDYKKAYFGYVPINQKFDKFTYRLAEDLKNRQQKGSLEYLFCDFYTDNFDYFYTEIQKNPSFNKTKIKEYYYQIVNRYVNMPDGHFNFFTGVWIPTKNASILGNHPILGLKTGGLYKKWSANFILYLKFGNTLNEYEIIYHDTIFKTDYFFGGYVGFNIERQLLAFKRNKIYISAGMGWDGFDAVKVNTNDNNPDNDEGKSINSLNLNTGINYRYRFKNNYYIGLSANLNYVNYKNTGGTDLSGNTFTITLSFGGFTNVSKNYSLKALRYLY